MMKNPTRRYSILAMLLTILSSHGSLAENRTHTAAAHEPREMPAPAIVFPALNVLDLKATESFYVNMLGMKVILRVGGAGDQLQEVTLNFSGDLYAPESALVLEYDASRTEPYRFDAFNRIAFRVSDLDAIVRRIREAGHRILAEPHSLKGTNIRLAFVADPNGARVQLIEGMASAEELERTGGNTDGD